jgi:hypothetical protein
MGNSQSLRPLVHRSVSIAQTAEDLRKIGELRYSLYIERDRKAYGRADHESRCFLEPIDSSSLNIFGGKGPLTYGLLRIG